METDINHNNLNKSIMKKWLTNSCEDSGICMIKTDAFKPVNDYKGIIDQINEIYVDNRYKPENTLLTYETFKDSIIVSGSTYLLQINNFMDPENVRDLREEEIKKSLSTDNVPEYLWNHITESQENSLAVGALIEMLIAPNQKIKVQITDTAYGNSDFVIEK